MFSKKNFMIIACLTAGILSAQPTAAISTLGKHIQTQAVDTTNSGNAGEYDLAEPSALHHFLPELIGPKLYLHLLQSDTFITLVGWAESMKAKHASP